MSDNIQIKDKELVEQKIQALKNGGAESLQVIADFDNTLSKGHVDGKKSASIIAQIRDSNCLSTEYSSKAHALFDHYNPIEIDTNIPQEEKIDKMHEWRKKHFDLLADSGLSKEVIDQVTGQKTLYLREGLNEFISLLYQSQVPLCIFSASIGDMIQIYLSQVGLLEKNIHIISNFLIYDEKGRVLGAKEPIIHSMNKSEVVIHEFPFYQELAKRKNIILMGDIIEDTGMSKGFDYENILTIGFCNITEQKDIYMQNFDIVLMNDPEMEEVNEILRKILG